MTRSFSELFLLTGMSTSEGMEYLGSNGVPLRKDTFLDWRSGKEKNVPVGIIYELQALIGDIEKVADGFTMIDLPYDSCYREAEKIRLRKNNS